MRKLVFLGVALSACANRPAAPNGASPMNVGSTHPAPAAAPARWAVPPCPLGYEMLTRETSEMDGAPPAFGVVLETFAVVDAQPRDGRLELGLSIFAHPVTSKYRPRIFAEKGYAAPRIETDGVRWTEVDGPTQAWSALGTQGGLVWFFPPLPPRGEPGATVAWEIRRPSIVGVLATESRRGSRRLPATRPGGAEPEEHDAPIVAEVRFERWEDTGGERVAHLVMTARYDLAGATTAPLRDVSVRGEARFKGQYAVLASGRLLSAEIESEKNVEMTWTMKGSESTQHHVQHEDKKMHLVSACDDPTTSRLDRAPTREERAIADYATTWEAIVAGDRDKALRGYAAALRRKHGDSGLWNAILAYRAERGEHALMAPALLSDDDVRADASAVRLRTHGDTPDRSTTNTVTPVVVEVTLREENGRFVVAELRGELEIAKGRVLEITEARLAVPRGWPPK